MTIEVKVPVLPESITEAAVLEWHKKAGDYVAEGENLVDIETEKVTMEVPAVNSGVLQEILQPAGATVTAEQVLGHIDETATATA
ncbi:MAG TPA: dihydrolipoamide succinyltransferase, partial [Gammaproteobacteria bacterium]|nr:dihydrolipoamide succinyltransferase [Gammaproteobacteria bacterium]